MTWNMLKQRFEIKRWYTILLNRLCFYLRLIFCLDDEKFYVEHILLNGASKLMIIPRNKITSSENTRIKLQNFTDDH